MDPGLSRGGSTRPRTPSGRRRMPPLVGLVLGSGLGAFAERRGRGGRRSLRGDPGFPGLQRRRRPRRRARRRQRRRDAVGRPLGADPLLRGASDGVVVFPARVLARLGVKAVDPDQRGGRHATLVPPRQPHAHRPTTSTRSARTLSSARNEEELGPRFPDMSRRVRREDLRAVRSPSRSAEAASRCRRASTSASTARPTRRRRRSACGASSGADAVGMSTVPEAIALNQMPACASSGISSITNMAAGVLKKP